MSVDVEIYMNNIVKFFRENPNDLLNLVPKTKEEEFYSKLREAAFQNYENGEEVNLTREQIIEICANIHGKTKKVREEKKEPTKSLTIPIVVPKLIPNEPLGSLRSQLAASPVVFVNRFALLLNNSVLFIVIPSTPLDIL
jgi:hypothetical protein